MGNKKFKLSTVEALALAIKVYNGNGNRIERDGDNSNKNLILSMAEKNIQATEYFDQAEEIRTMLNQQVMLKMISNGKVNGFLSEVNDLLMLDNIPNNKIGLLAWAPKLFDDVTNTETAREEILKLAMNSVHIGKIGSRIEVIFTPISSRFLRSYNSYIITGCDEHGNLLSTWRNTPIPAGSKLSAKVKDHKCDSQYSNANVTAINYVKIKGEVQ